MRIPLRVLLIEDSDIDAQLLLREVEQSGYDTVAQRVETLEDFRTALLDQPWNLILADYSMPHLDISQALALLQEVGKDIPFIVVSGTIDDPIAASLMKLGAHDYFDKDKLARLGPAISRELKDAHVRNVQRRLEQVIQFQAFHDSLTNLPNRALFNERLQIALAHAAQHTQKLAIFFIDMDEFKLINDLLGHETGDWLLQNVAKRLTHALSKSDFLARLGGDEFLLLSEIGATEDAIQIARRILEVLKPPFVYNNQEMSTTVSIGISIFPDHGDDPHILLRNADTALYQTKQNGRNDFHLFSAAMASDALLHKVLSKSLRRAIQKEELVPYFQLQIDTQTGKVAGSEALLRWRIPGLDAIGPDVFLFSVREDKDLIMALEEWMWKNAATQNKAWQDAGLPRVAVGLHLTAHHCRHKTMAPRLAEILEKTGLEPCYVDLAINSTFAMRDKGAMMSILGELKKIGIRISLDDFGAGAIRLIDLKDYPFDAIKIHPSIIQDIHTNTASQSIAQAAILLAHQHDMEVVAKGVETRDQLKFLRDQRCDKIQGFLLGHPAPAEHFEKFFGQENAFLQS